MFDLNDCTPAGMCLKTNHRVLLGVEIVVPTFVLYCEYFPWLVRFVPVIRSAFGGPLFIRSVKAPRGNYQYLRLVESYRQGPARPPTHRRSSGP
jgi:hypothetical protein